MKLFLSIMGGKISPPVEVGFTRKDETPAFIEVHIGLIKKDGKIRGVQVIARDITQRKQMQEEKEKEKQKLFSVLDVIPAFVYLQAPDYSVRFVNRKFRELFGDPGDWPCYEAFYGRKKPCDPCIYATRS